MTVASFKVLSSYSPENKDNNHEKLSTDGFRAVV
jgi:hypothetical protein